MPNFFVADDNCIEELALLEPAELRSPGLGMHSPQTICDKRDVGYELLFVRRFCVGLGNELYTDPMTEDGASFLCES